MAIPKKMKHILIFTWGIIFTISCLVLGLLFFIGYTAWHFKLPPQDVLGFWWENVLSFIYIPEKSEKMSNKDYTKEFFQRAWGRTGYVENFSYGVGIEAVCAVALNPFKNSSHDALEIGPGGGTFTERLLYAFRTVTAIDVIAKPPLFNSFPDHHFRYFELPDQCFECKGVENESVDFVFSYNCFCHLSDEALKTYFKDVARVTRKGGNFVFMLSWFEKVRQYFPDTADQFKKGDLLPNGHFYQNRETVLDVADPEEWMILTSNMIPEHRDLLVHLRRI